MQDSHITPLKKAVGNAPLAIAIKLLLLAALLTYIAVELFQSQGLIQEFQSLWLTIRSAGWSFLYSLLILLVPLNWLLEARKWQVLLKPVTHIGLLTAVKGVLTGLSLGFMTPHSLGDYLGRIGQLQAHNRLDSLGAILLGRGAQFIATLLFGLMGLWAWLRVDHTSWGLWCFAGTVGAVLVLLGLLVFARTTFVNVCNKLWPAAARFVQVLSTYTAQQAMVIFGLSVLRYMVFASQFFLLLLMLNVPLPWFTLWAGVTWVLLAKSVIPAFNFLSDLGVREFSALYFFGLFTVSPAAVLSASLSVWILNILLPTLMGSLFIIQMKLIRK